MATSTVNNPNSVVIAYPEKTSGSKWTGGTISLRKCNGIVMVKLDGAVLSAISAREAIATVPEGFIPVTESYFFDSSGVRSFLIKTNGEMQANSQAAGTVWGTECYIAG